MVICCRYDVNQSSIRYSDVKQLSITDPTSKNIKPPQPEYEAVNMKPPSDIKMDVNPAYGCDVKLDVDPANVKMDAIPAYQVTIAN